MDNPVLMTGAKWVGAAVAVVAIAVVLYLGAVLSVYAIAWVIDVIGMIFG